MSSIKERAAALNLAEKLCVRPPAHGGSAKPAQASSMWSSIISHLRSSVTVKRRWVHLKSHGDCFLGSEAVEVVARHLVQGVRGLEGAIVSRDKVVCVCQALLNCGVFESVGTKVFGKDKRLDVFQDTRSALYRFVGVCAPSIDDLERAVFAKGIQHLLCSASLNRESEETCLTSSQAHMSSPVKSPCMSKDHQLSVPVPGLSLPVEPLVDSLSPSRVHTDTGPPQSLVDEVWQEQTLLRLLKLVDLPLLEGVLQCSQAPSSPLPSPRPQLAHSNPDLIYSSNHLDRQILKAFRESQEDEWLCAALDCLDFLPDQLVVELSRELPQCFPQQQDNDDGCEPGMARSNSDGGVQSLRGPLDSIEPQPRLFNAGLSQCKVLLYRTLVRHYSHTDRPPLLPQHMADIYTAITVLLVNAKLDTTLEALQLCLKLLPPTCREELRRLLTFMALAADPREMRLDREMKNRLAVKKSFSRAVFQSKTLSKENEDLMVVFMLSNIKEIFKIPGALHKGVSDKLAAIVQGKQPDVTDSTFCQQVSSRTYTESTKKTTNQELWALLRNIHLDPKISAKEKKRLLRHFYQAHPEIFHQYFGESAASLL